MSAEIIQLNVLTTLDINAAKMLREIAKDKPAYVFCVVWPEDEKMPAYHSNTSDIPAILMRLREFEHKYFNGDFE